MLANWNLLSMLSALVGYVANACVHGKGARVRRTMRTMRACVFFPRVLFFSKAFAVQVFTFIFVRGPHKTFPHIFDDVFLVDIFEFFGIVFSFVGIYSLILIGF